MSKQDKVVELVKAGKYTRKELLETVKCTSGALASYLSGMRNAAKYTGDMICPVVDESGCYGVDTFENVEAAKAERIAKAKPVASKKTAAERIDAAKKRVIRCANVKFKAQERADADTENVEWSLRYQKADIEAQLADIELERCQALPIELLDTSVEQVPDKDKDPLE